jgi:hypothetical protein
MENQHMTHEYIGTKQVTAWAQEKDGKEGYAVKYADGYTSWSPKEVFEASYIDIGHVSHLPTHQQRVIGEKAVLDDRLTKLRQFFGAPMFAGLSNDEQDRLQRQAVAMTVYSELLAARIAAF